MTQTSSLIGTSWDDMTPEKKFEIKDKILLGCIGIGQNVNGYQLVGFSKDKDAGLGYALLCYFTSGALGIRRLPFFEDRVYVEESSQSSSVLEATPLLAQLTPQRIDVIQAELKELYEFVQTDLKSRSLKTVTLSRGIRFDDEGYASTLVRLKLAAEIVGQTHIEFDMDLLNSFSSGGYSGIVTLDMEFPIEDVLYYSGIVGKDSNGGLEPVEGGEWVVINRALNGVVQIAVKDIIIDDKLVKQKALDDLNETGAKVFLAQHTPFTVRCREHPKPKPLFHKSIDMTWRFKMGQWLERMSYYFLD
ncbi:hypothetical protein ACEWBY_05570 [Vibrio parahaemolyticus]